MLSKEEIILSAMQRYWETKDGANDIRFQSVEELKKYMDKDPDMNLFLEVMEEYANQDKWINCKNELPDIEKVGNKVLLFREMNEGQKGMAITVYDTFLVKHCEPETTFWQKLPNPPKQ